MMNFSENVITRDEQAEIKEFIAILLLLSKEDRAMLLSNANALKVRGDIEKARKAIKQKANAIPENNENTATDTM